MLIDNPIRVPSAVVAATGADSVVDAANVVYQNGGRHILTDVAQQSLRESATDLVNSGTTNLVVNEALKTAGKQVLGGVGKASGLGAFVDGGVAAIEVVPLVVDGQISAKTAGHYIAREAGSGAAASAAGVAAAAGLTALTGPLGPLAIGVGATTAVAVKLAIRAIF